MAECRLCKTTSVRMLLDVGMQPVSNRFVADREAEEYRHAIVLGQCGACGLVQLIHSAPADQLLPPYEWITYNEPEGHLDRLVDIVSRLPGVTTDATICGVSYKEESSLERFRKQGFGHTWRIDQASDLGIIDARAGIETIQDRLRPHLVSVLRERYGAPDVIIARHILEHAHNVRQFIETLRMLVKPAGYVIFEVPDCTQLLTVCDCTMLWEEHVLYFTAETFRRCFSFLRFALVRLESYPYPYETSLVGITQPVTDGTSTFLSESVLGDETRRAQAFAEGVSLRRRSLKRFLSDYRRNQGKVAVFGAGHLASMFINIMELKDMIEFVVDDNPQKQELLMPGSRLPIRSSDALIRESIKLCLSSLSPESEEKVILKNQAFRDRGGIFASIFPTSRHALQI